jgi:transmembrane sensor
MNGEITDEALRRALLQQAADWHARSTSEEMTSQQKIDFLSWLRDNPNHIEQYLGIQRMTQSLRQVLSDVKVAYREHPAESAEEEGSTKVISFPTVRQRRGKIISIAATLIVAILALPYIVTHWMRTPDRVIEVGHGDQHTERLADGSVIHLNSKSRAHVRFTDKERLIELEQGQGFFKVAPDKRRPLRVHAGNADIVAVGTQFDVYLKSTGTMVTVVEGKVRVIEQPKTTIASKRIAIPLEAGEQIRIDGAAKTQAPKPVDVREATAWTRHEISFKGLPLGEVAEEYGRYLDVPIQIEDPILRASLVTGMFDVYDPTPFIAFLRSLDGVEVIESRNAVYVRVRAGARETPR